MAFRPRLLESADQELRDIVSYLVGHSDDAARGFLDAFERQLDLLCSGVVSCGFSRMPELARLGYRSVLVGRYVFLYYLEEDCVVVAHLFHQRQDYVSLVTEGRERGVISKKGD